MTVQSICGGTFGGTFVTFFCDFSEYFETFAGQNSGYICDVLERCFGTLGGPSVAFPYRSFPPPLPTPFGAVISSGTIVRMHCVGDYAGCSLAEVAGRAYVKRARDLGDSIRRVSFFPNLE